MRSVIRKLDIGRIFAALALVLGAACPSTLPKYDYAQEPDPRNKEIVLGIGDAVSINVWEQKELNTDATIRPDGMITMPLIGDLKAVGETPSTLKAKIKARLQEFVVKLQGTDITVAVRSWKSYRFTIQGEVQHPGVFTADQYVTVADALALAGGLSRFAKRDEVAVLRREGKSGQLRRIPIDYDA